MTLKPMTLKPMKRETMRMHHRKRIARIVTSAAVLLTAVCASGEEPEAKDVNFSSAFLPQTMRLDYFLAGTKAEEHVALDQIVSDGPWPGSRTRLIDTLNLGKYRYQVRDAESKQLLFSRGFSSIYGEWETTAPAKVRWGTFHESLRFPWPKNPVRVHLQKRGKDNVQWEELWSTKVEPDSRAVNNAAPPRLGKVRTVLKNGEPARKVDLLILGDGYTAEEMDSFHEHTKRLVGALFSVEPFRGRKSDFNVWAIETPAAESGVSRPHAGIYRRPVLGTTYSTFDSERYALTRDNRALRNVACAAPYDFLVILVNERTYGGGGIYGDQTALAARSGFADYLMIHELGHHFAGLGDEYYTSDVAYEEDRETIPEPWRPNITALHDPAALKWRHLVDPDTPIPTPWNKEVFESISREIQKTRKEMRAAKAPEEKLEALFRSEREKMARLLASSRHAKKVGAFEGGGYQAKGLYRPAADCIMFTRDEVGFCPVCREAIQRVIDHYSGE